MNRITCDEESSIQNLETGKNILLQRLLKDKLISSETANEFCTKYVFVILDTKWYKFWNKKASHQICLVKVVD